MIGVWSVFDDASCKDIDCVRFFFSFGKWFLIATVWGLGPLQVDAEKTYHQHTIAILEKLYAEVCDYAPLLICMHLPLPWSILILLTADKIVFIVVCKQIIVILHAFSNPFSRN